MLLRERPARVVHRPDEPGPDPATFLEGLLSKHGRLRFTPGTTSRYSNLGVLIVGAVPLVALLRYLGILTITYQSLAVVGGAPAGLEAARLLAASGHRVALYEAADQNLYTAKHGGRNRVAG